MGGLQPMHWVIVIVVFALLFGAKKLPDLARSLGKSLRIFKSEVKELQNEGKSADSAPPAVEQQQVTPPTIPVEAPPIESTPGHKPTA